ncbi:unnamed protein product [Rotaria sordida]|uniref:Uncharacterized protein n=1 Tax=Rotaria sordida TaxID=392033 RepID=A0A815U9C5_9BILA|nr:unnamed protein product [Rotaria sordida]CAF1516693.1 unnamed protein product [Rotaria sordida]
MITEDNVNTARSIALKCGIISSNDDYLILEGKEFNQRIRSRPDGKAKTNFEKIFCVFLFLIEVEPNLRILARSSPQDKYVLVRGIMASKIKSTREVVTVAGFESS